jgi:isoleucyl-tRNA synthetase
VFDIVLDTLCKWLAPFLCFTAEEAWLARHPSEDGSVHLELFPEIPAAWRDDALAAKWARIREVRRVVTGALEVERVAKRIGSSLQAAPLLTVSSDIHALLDGLDMAEICITSGMVVVDGLSRDEDFALPDVAGVSVVPHVAQGVKCQRCWRVLHEVGTASHEGVCHRCSDAIDEC